MAIWVGAGVWGGVGDQPVPVAEGGLGGGTRGGRRGGGREGGREGKTVKVVEVEQERGKEEGRNGVCE